MLSEGQLGACRARRAHDGKVVCENYGRITSLALDPIEKKPLARFMPKAKVLSVGSYGCNLHCPFCQNASIAAAGSEDVRWSAVTPDELVQLALDTPLAAGIAYTYNEPFVGFEFVRDCAKLAREAGLANVVVSNGMICAEPLEELSGLIDAANIDLKGCSQEFYDFVGGSFETVRSTIRTLAAQKGCHLEVTTLVVPGRNDTARDIEAIARWLAAIDPNIPYHISRFFPCHHMADAKPTPVHTVYALADIARAHLRYVYTGNC